MASTGSLEPAPAERLFADRNVGLFVAFRVLFNARFYYPVFMILFLDFGITLEQFGLLNAIWAATIVLLEVPSGALALGLSGARAQPDRERRRRGIRLWCG